MSDDHYHSQDSSFGQGMTPEEARRAGERDAAVGGGNDPVKPPQTSYPVWDAFLEGRNGKS